MLIWLGCQHGQGWRYGKAAPFDEIQRAIAADPVSALPELGSPGSDWATSSLEALPTLRLAQLQAIYDGAPVGLCFLNKKLQYVSLNQRLAEMNGRSVKEHLGHSVQEMYPQWFPTYEPYYLRALEGEAILNAEFIRPKLTAGEKDCRMVASYQPAWDESDEVIGISMSLLEITEPLELSAPAFTQLVPHEASAGASRESPWVMDAEGNDLQVSSRWVQTTPMGKDWTRNLLWLEAIHIEDLEPTIKIMRRALRTGMPIDVEYRVPGGDGEWRWVRSRGTPRFAPNGEISRWYGSVEDIHDLKLQQARECCSAD
jgi:PAS domain S-box-containing protein